MFCVGEGKPKLEGGSSAKFLTAMELGTNNTRITRSFSKNKGWEIIPDILENESVVAPKTVINARTNLQKITTYELKPVALIQDTANLRNNTQKSQNLDHIIFCKPPITSSYHCYKFVPRKVFAKIDATIPPPNSAHTDECFTHWKLQGICMPPSSSNKNRPFLHGCNTWYVEDSRLLSGSGKKHPMLEIDLGQLQTVTRIFTQGGAPPVRQYPSISSNARVEGHTFKGKYKGPFWNVVDPEFHWFAGKRTSQLRWVKSYELCFRADGGRQWNSLGIFKGNHDTTTAIAHSLANYRGGNFRCRYLRFIPIDCEKGGAMRIAIYGKPTGTKIELAAVTTTGPCGEQRYEASGDNDLLQYDLFHPCAIPGKHLQRDVLNWSRSKSYSDDHGCTNFRKNRKVLKEQSRRDAKKGIPAPI